MKLSPRSWAAGGASGVTSYADQNEASPPLGAANSETVATVACFWLAQRRDVLRRNWKLSPRAHASGRASGVAPYADQNESSLSLRIANCETVNTFVDSSEAQRNDCIRRSK